ncbi:hypothetical protein [uncultured Gammaproteobacteria bacterium]|nr:hypothetical protein [uncultured Gammaproteobacteria bacterium]
MLKKSMKNKYKKIVLIAVGLVVSVASSAELPPWRVDMTSVKAEYISDTVAKITVGLGENINWYSEGYNGQMFVRIKNHGIKRNGVIGFEDGNWILL